MPVPSQQQYVSPYFTKAGLKNNTQTKDGSFLTDSPTLAKFKFIERITRTNTCKYTTKQIPLVACHSKTDGQKQLNSTVQHIVQFTYFFTIDPTYRTS